MLQVCLLSYLKVSSDRVAGLAYLDCLHHASVAQLSQYQVVIKLTWGLKTETILSVIHAKYHSNIILHVAGVKLALLSLSYSF